MIAHPTRRQLALVLLFGVTAFISTRATAQQQLGSLKQIEDTYRRLESVIFKLEMGQVPPGKQEQAAMDAVAKWLIYRYVSSPPPDVRKINKFHTDFESHIIKRVQGKEYKKVNREFVKQFGPILKQRYQDLFNQDFIEYRYSIINAAPTLVMAAQMHDDTIGAYLSELITDHDAGKGNSGKNRHDVIKLYAVRGLREYMPVEAREKDEVLSDVREKRKKRDLRAVAALLSFIDRPAAKKLSEPEQHALRFLRREALETLAQAESPAVVFGKAVVEAPVAPILLRVLSPKSGLDPAPGLPERIEAAIGVCQLRCAKVPDYQPEVGIYLVGRTIHEVLTAYNKDLIAIKGAVDQRPAALHWRLQSKRLELALKTLVDNMRGLPAQANAMRLARDGARMLKEMQGRNLQSLNQVEVGAFRTNIVDRLRPASGQVFKNIKEYSIELDE